MINMVDIMKTQQLIFAINSNEAIFLIKLQLEFSDISNQTGIL